MSHPPPSNEGATLNGSAPSITRVDEKEKVSPSEPRAPTPQVDDADFPHGLKLAVLMLALCLAVFLVALVSLNRDDNSSHQRLDFFYLG